MIFLIIIVTLLKIIDLCYLFQIKEYRFDRLRSKISEDGVLQTLYLRLPKFPARSVRNALIMFISIIMLVASLWLYLQKLSDLTVSIAVLVLSPFVSLNLVSTAVLLTRPLAYALRTQTVMRAKAMIKSHTDLVGIGISGSYGKTSTKEFLYQMLSTKYKVAKTDKNMNTDVGVAKSIIENLKPETQYLIAEVGAYRQGEVAKATKVFMPKIAIITAFGNQHLDLYGSRENLIKAEGEILEYLPTSGVAYINKLIPSYDITTKRTKARIVSFSSGGSGAEITASDIKVDSKGLMRATITYADQSFNISTVILGTHNISNLLPCIALCLDLGMKSDEVIASIRQLQQVPKKLSMHKGPENSRILNDSGNSSVDGFLAAIDTMLKLNYAKNIILTKGIIELGKEKESSYKTIISSIVNKPIQLYTTDKLFTKYDTTTQVHYIRSEKVLLAKIMSELDNSTLVLIEGKFTPIVASRLILL